MADNQNAQANLKRGMVKQVLTGDAVVLQSLSTPQSGPPKELTVYLANVSAPRLAKRPTSDGSDGTVDEPYAWEAREFLRRKLVGKTIVFVKDFLATSGREHGRIYLGGTRMEDAENVAESAVSEGWLEVRPGKQPDENTQKLLEAQERAKAAKKGRWSDDDPQKHVRSIRWTVDDMQATLAEWKKKEVDVTIEQVRDGSTMRLFLPNSQYITVMLSGVKTPGARLGGSEGKAEEFGEEAKFFAETRLLQRDVKLILEGVGNQNFISSVIHPRGNIAEFLLKEGYAKLVEWSLGLATGGAQAFRDAERYAKERKLRLWKGYTGPVQSSNRKSFNAKVVEIGLVDNVTLKLDDDREMKAYFSSLRAPRREGPVAGAPGGGPPRPLFDTPFMLDAREFLRKRLLGKRVNVTVDYIQPESKPFPEKTCCTVIFNGKNVAETLIAKGLARVARHKQDDDNRSPHYDALLAAETQAESEKVGVWSVGKEGSANGTIGGGGAGVVRVKELQGDAQKSRQFLPYLQRSPRLEAIVEHVFSGSRLRVYIPKESCVITFLLSGIKCPVSRRGPGGRPIGEEEPFADEAAKFTRSKSLQQDVQIEVESMDKAGAFVGYLFVPVGEKGSSYANLSELLVEEGLASVHFTAERSAYYGSLTAAEKRAKEGKLRLWLGQNASAEVDAESEAKLQASDAGERKLNYRKVIVTEILPELKFACQFFDDGPAIESLMTGLQSEMQRSSEEDALEFPRRGQLAAVMLNDLWHRAKIEAVRGDKAEVHFIDFGNRAVVATSNLLSLPSQFLSQPASAKEYQLALVQAPKDAHYAEYTTSAFERLSFAYPHLYLNVEYRVNNALEAATLASETSGSDAKDIGRELIATGNALADSRREPRFQKLIADYQAAEAEARRRRLSIWEYGDFTGSEI